MRKVSDKEREKLSAEIAGLESLDLNQLRASVEASLRNRSSSTSEPGLAKASGCVPHPGERARRSQAGHAPTARTRRRRCPSAQTVQGRTTV
jgi:hypothetical protein